ncbi:membrane protein [Paenibacillus swuensis]|uniref:Membrane protein n=1 Tax=Paenibacillus swuensis TaxID=1178515 RepID=A0A172TJI6_9BACL|nr:outer membrane lipoprotein-sorting protein [Paenibacillus swuensis]ANE47064.1 membrane protein [Paenibacillus swuensis]
MRKVAWILAMVMCVSFLLAACGAKDASGVVKELESKAKKLDSYQGTGTMTLHTGQQPQEYNVEIWYKQPHFYRISLQNEKKDISQVVLRNDDGVFVLTPHLNKSFRFQSNWPDQQGQVYLYQTLLQSILMDQTRQFASDKENYLFDVVANYQNGSLARQKIWLSKDDYAPQKVEVSDSNANVVVEVNFDQFEFNKKFDKDSFDMQRNMTASLSTIPTISKEEADVAQAVAGEATKETEAGETESTDAAGKKAADEAVNAEVNDKGKEEAQGTETEGTEAEGTETEKQEEEAAAEKGHEVAEQPEAQPNLPVIEPDYLPEGVVKKDETELKLGESNAVSMRYAGEYNYTLVQTRSKVDSHTATAIPGDLMDLGFPLGVISGEAIRTLTWNHDGVEFRLSSGDLTDNEFIRIAQSVQGEIGK